MELVSENVRPCWDKRALSITEH